MRKHFFFSPSMMGYEISNLIHLQSKVGCVSNKLIGRFVRPSIDLPDARAEFIEKYLEYAKQRQIEGCTVRAGDMQVEEIHHNGLLNDFDSITIDVNGSKYISEF